jgi:hypothetical protein
MLDHMGTDLLTRNGTTCPVCRDTVLRFGDLVLDAEPVTGGLYQLTLHRPRRRALTDLFAEQRAHRPVRGGGHDVHTCPVPGRWSDR